MSADAAIAAVVLAAGRSRRMGRCKPLLRLGSTSYLGHILSTVMASGAVPVVVVGADRERVAQEAHRLEPTAVVLSNPRWRSGMLSSIQRAVTHLDNEADVGALLLWPVDMPRIAPATVVSLMTAYRAQAPLLTLPCFRGRHGHPALFDRRLWPALLSAPPEQGARAVVDAHRDDIREIAVDDVWILRDADTPEAHRRMQQGL